MIIKICTLTRLNRKADKSVSLSFTTMSEQTTHEMAALDSLFQQDCVIAIKESENQFRDVELDDLDSIDVDLYDNKKTKSQRLRNTLYRCCETQKGRAPSDEEWKEFYSITMETVITHFKNKIHD